MYKRILTPVNGSKQSDRGLQEACTLAHHETGALKIIHIAELEWPMVFFRHESARIEDDQGYQNGQTILDKARTLAVEAGIDPETELLFAESPSPGKQIIEAATNWQADLIVMGTYTGSSVRTTLFGGVADAILHASTIPVLVVPLKAPRRAGDVSSASPDSC